jgi:hypothetical protein
VLQTLLLLPKSQLGQLIWINAPTSFLSYCHHMKSARVLTLAERALVAEWIACAGDIGEAYVSGRRDDDLALRNRVVIVTKPEDGLTHLFHAPARRGIWIVLSLGSRTKVQRFRTLRAALNAVRPVLVTAGSRNLVSMPWSK